MRITYALGWSRAGRQACQEQTIGTAASLARAGADITLLMPRGPGDPAVSADDLRAHFQVDGGFRVVQRPFVWPDTGLVPSFFWLRSALSDPTVQDADLTLTRIPVVLITGADRRRPFVFDHYRPWPDQLPMLRGRFRRVLNSPNCLGVVVHSDFAAESYRRLPTPSEKLLVAHNGFDLAGMAPVISKAAARKQLGLPADRPIVVYAGRLNRKKGLDQVLLMAGLRPEIMFLLVGSEGDGAIEEAARPLPNIQLVPWQEPQDLPPYLYAADVLLIPPSLGPLQKFGSTILPLKTFKYLAAGRPILAPFAPDTAEILRDGDNAMLIPPGDPSAAVAALDRLLCEPALADRLGRNAARTASERTWDHRAQKLLGFFDQGLSAFGG